MFSKIKAIKDMRDQAKELQRSLEGITAEGSGARGKVTIKMNGNQKVLSVQISEEIVGNKHDLEMAVTEAFNDVMKNMQKELSANMKNLGGAEMLKNLGL